MTRGDGKRASRRRDVTVAALGEQVEGGHAVRHALEAGRRKVSEVLMDERLADSLSGIEQLAARSGAKVRRLSPQAFGKAVKTSAPQGVVAMCRPLPLVPLEVLGRRTRESKGFLVLLDGIEDPRNLGAILRSAEAMGATGAILPERGGAPLSPAAMKAAAGAVEYLDLAVVSSTARAIDVLKREGLWVVVLDESGEAIFDAPLLVEPLVLAVGSEGKGARPLVKKRADLVASIPMLGRIESLNASAAVAAACAEIARSRCRET